MDPAGFIEGQGVEPDALMAAVGILNRDWGCYGYTVVGLDAPTFMGARVHVRHLDGSRFMVAVDRWGNRLTWAEGDSNA
jgi:hypothetical protein